MSIAKKVSRHYRIRQDILDEMAGMLVLMNKDGQEGEKEVTETYIVEASLVMFINRFKREREKGS